MQQTGTHRIIGLMRGASTDFQPIDAFGLDGDAIEAQGMAYLAARFAAQLPSTFKGTTGVATATVGGGASTLDAASILQVREGLLETKADTSGQSLKTDTVTAVVLLLAGLFMLDIMSVLAKILRQDYPPTYVALARNMFAFIPLVGFIYFENKGWINWQDLKIKQWRLAILRGLLVAFAQCFLYGALGHLALATTISISYAMPFMITILSIFVLGERVGVWRWLAVVVGFLGVIWIIRPGSDLFSWWAVMPVAAAFLYAITLVLARRFEPGTSNAIINFYSISGACISSILLIGIGSAADPSSIIQDLPLTDLLIAMLMGIVGGCGVYCLTLAFRLGEASFLASFEYFGIFTSLIFGWFIFHEWPVAQLFPGVLLIVGAGLVIVVRGQHRK